MSFVTAVRLVVDFEQAEHELRVQVAAVRLVIFGDPGERRLVTAIGDSEETSWFIPLVVGQDLTKVDINSLDRDPTELDVYYMCCKSETAPFRKDRVSTKGYPVVKFIADELSHQEKYVEPPEPEDKYSSEGGTAKKEPPCGKTWCVNITRERYFWHCVRLYNIPAFLGMLSDEAEIEADHCGLAPVYKDTTSSTYLWVSWHTIEKMSKEEKELRLLEELAVSA